MGADECNMPIYDLLRRRPGLALPTILLAALAAGTLSQLIGHQLLPALMQLNAGR